MKISEAIKIIKPEYVFLKLKPNNSIRNNGTHKVSRAISGLYRNVFENIKREEEKLIKVFGKEFNFPTKISIQNSAKISYFVYIEKSKIEFYFIVPNTQLLFIKEKISDVWSNVTIEQVETLPRFNDVASKYQVCFKKEDGLSLAIDRRNNDLLNSNLNVVEMLEEGDKLGLFYNFIPSAQRSWRFQHKETIDKVKKGKPVERDKIGWSYLLKWGISSFDSLFNSIFDVVAGDKKKSILQEDGALLGLLAALNGGNKTSVASIKKGQSIVLPTQIAVISESRNKVREKNLARSLAQSFDTISEDNELIYKPMKRAFRYTDYSIGTERNIMGDEEVQNFISIAGRDILEKYNFIEHVETNETQVPEDLQKGVLCIGENTYRGFKQKAYISNDSEYRNLLLLLIAPTRAGKTNLMSNLSIDAIESGECVIIFDFIENCELSDSVAALFPKSKRLDIRCDNVLNIQGMGYNEAILSNDPFEQYDSAKKQTSNLLALVNSIHSSEGHLTPRMERYLESASLIVFVSGGSIKDVFAVLQSFKQRLEFLKKVPSKLYEYLDEYMDNLDELNEYDKTTGQICGTKSASITFIIDRLNTLKRNAYMERMLKKDTKNNFNLVDEMQKNQLITIQMPQNMFSTEFEKDTCVLYWLTKLWFAAQIRASNIKDKTKRVKVNVLIDELYQCPNSEMFLTTKLSQMAKFILKPIISCHYINQLKHMRNELRSANASYMLISGCDKKNFDELKTELAPYTDEDLKNLKRYHSLNLIKSTAQGYGKFITELPEKVENRIRRSQNDSKN